MIIQFLYIIMNYNNYAFKQLEVQKQQQYHHVKNQEHYAIIINQNMVIQIIIIFMFSLNQ